MCLVAAWCAQADGTCFSVATEARRTVHICEAAHSLTTDDGFLSVQSCHDLFFQCRLLGCSVLLCCAGLSASVQTARMI